MIKLNLRLIVAVVLRTVFGKCVLIDLPDLKWDISLKDTTIVRDFTAYMYMVYTPTIEFRMPAKTNFLSMLSPLPKFRGAIVPLHIKIEKLDIKNKKPPTSDTPEITRENLDISQESPRIKSKRLGIKIRKRPDENDNKPIVDQTCVVKCAASQENVGRNRNITYFTLKPGKYRLTASTIQETMLPPDVKTFLVLRTYFPKRD